MNFDIILIVCNVLMVAIWMVYLHLFYQDSRRRNRPFMIIHHAQSNDPDSLCLFVNMSKEPIHIQCVLVYLYHEDNQSTFYLTEYLRHSPDPEYPYAGLHEGPIQPGGHLVLGSFRDILLGRRSDNEDKQPLSDNLQHVSAFEICVAAIHGPTEYNIGARRKFALETHGSDMQIRAHSIHTEQLVSRRKRQTVRRWIEDRLQPEHTGKHQTQQTRQTEKDPY